MQKNKKIFSIYDMCTIAVFTAVISILAQISIPMPTGIPFTLQTFAVTLTAIVLGTKKGTGAVLIYLLLGIVGVPVFANLKGGLHVLVGPTGGFLLSFPVMTFLIGLGADTPYKKWFFPTTIVLGTVCNYLIGLIVYCISTECNIWTGFLACILPFLPSGIIMTVLAVIIGKNLRRRLVL